MTKYTATVASVSDSGVEDIATATGSFSLANFAAKEGFKAIAEQDGEFRVSFTAVDETGAERKIVSVTGDADVVTYVAKKKIAAERKSVNGADDSDATDSE
jgi:hypothetical protein